MFIFFFVTFVVLFHQCGAAVDNLAAFYFNNITVGESPPSLLAVNLARHIAECPNLFPEVSHVILFAMVTI